MERDDRVRSDGDHVAAVQHMVTWLAWLDALEAVEDRRHALAGGAEQGAQPVIGGC